MYRKVLILLFLSVFLSSGIFSKEESKNTTLPLINNNHSSFNDINLEWINSLIENGDLPNKDALEKAITGYRNIPNKKKAILTLIDFSRPSTEKRLFVLDLENQKLLFSSLVSHGKKSGENFATSFSNKRGSNKSSLGFFLTENTYKGRNGYSLILNGLEKGINDMAKSRSIVIHGASYCNPEVLKSGGRLGRSQGCPAIPATLNRPIIDVIKDGSVIYIYANESDYFKKSHIL